MLQAAQSLTLATRFLVEVAALVAYAWWGWHLPTSLPVRLLAAVGTPAVAAVVWGLLAAPKAPVHLAPPLLVGVQVVVLGGAVAALASAGRTTLAVLLGVVALVDGVLLAWWRL